MNFTNLSHFMDEMVLKRTPGCAVSVTKEGKSVFKKAAGVSDLESGTKLTGEELFYIYSCSKILTVAAALTLMEKGKFLLSDPLGEYIPEFKKMTVRLPNKEIVDAQKEITLLNLFNMTAGFNYDLNAAWKKEAARRTDGTFDTLETIKCMAEAPLDFEPGTRWQYSLCHDVLAGVVSAISGMKFRDYVRTAIFEPLGMENTFYHITPETEAKMAEQYQFVPEGENTDIDLVEAQKQGNAFNGTFVNVGKQNTFIFGTEYDSGGAGVITTVDDYIKFLSALARGGVGTNGNQILSKYTVQLMRMNALSAETQSDFNWTHLRGYGYGLGVRTMINPIEAGSLSPVGEFGWCGAAGATAIIDPESEMAAFFVQHTLNPREEYYMPRLRNVIYSGLDRH